MGSPVALLVQAQAEPQLAPESVRFDVLQIFLVRSLRAFARATEIEAELRAETRYLDELLDSIPRPAFAADDQVASGKEQEEANLERLDLSEQVRLLDARRREQQRVGEICSAFIREFRDQMELSELFEAMWEEVERRRAMEAMIANALNSES